MTIPDIAQVKALNGRMFAMLDEQDLRVLEFYRAQGRKYDVVVDISNKADPVELAKAGSRAQADEIMKRANSVVIITIGTGAKQAWVNRAGQAAH